MNGSYIVTTSIVAKSGYDAVLNVPIEARTAHEAEMVVRRDALRNPEVRWFSVDLVREVQTVWNPESGRYDMPLVVLTDYWSHRLPAVNHVATTNR